MKPSFKIFFAISLVANGVLLFAWLRPSGAASAVDKTSSHLGSVAAPVKGPQSTDWTTLQTDLSDPQKLLAHLEKNGVPPDIARALVTWQILETFRPRREAIINAEGGMPFWGDRNTAFSRSAANKLQAISREQNEALRAALGTDIQQDSGEELNQQLYAFLPADKISEVARIVADYSTLRGQLSTEMSSVRLPEDREKLLLLEKEMRSDLAAALTPEELENYDLHRSNTANNLRFTLGSFGPTEDEFRAIFSLRREFDEQYNFSAGPLDPSAMGQRQKAQTQLNEQIKTALGDERYAAYDRSQSFGYRAADQIARHFNLPAENAVAVFDLERATQKQLSEIRINRIAAPPEALATTTASIIHDAFEKLGTLLTPAGAAAYRDTAGFWLRAPTIPQTPQPSASPTRP